MLPEFRESKDHFPTKKKKKYFMYTACELDTGG